MQSGYTQQDLQKMQQMAQTLMQQGSSSAPVASPMQGMAQLAQAAVGNYQNNRANTLMNSNLSPTQFPTAPKANLFSLGGAAPSYGGGLY